MFGKVLFVMTLFVVLCAVIGQRFIIYPHHIAQPYYHVPAAITTYRTVYRSPVVYYGDGFDGIDGFNT